MAVATLSLGACAAACGPQTAAPVASPGGVYRPGAGCTLVEASGDCPRAAAADGGVQLRFEAQDATGLQVSTADTLSGMQVTCTRSYCGTGSLTAHADFRWDDAINNDPRRMGTFVHTFEPPLDLLGRTITFAVSVEGPTVPMHAQVGVVSDYWHWVAWAPLPPGWTRIAGVVSPDNALTKLDPASTAVLVHAIQIDVYVPVAPASGPTGAWSGTIYLDEVGWR